MEGWKEVKLKTLIKTMGDGGTPSTLDSANYGGDIPWVVVEDVEPEIFSTRDSLTEKGLSKCSAKMWEPETVILTTGATIGKVGVAKIPLCTKQGITGIVCNQFLHNYYLKYWLEANTNQLIRYSQGTTFKEIRTRSLGNLKIKVPKPYTKESISEQTAIAKILSTVDEAIRSTRETISKLERVKKSLMQNLLSGKMKPDGTLRPAAEFYEDDKMGLVPKGWKSVKLKEVADIQRGKFGHRPRNDERFYNGQYPFVQTSDVVNSIFYLKGASQSLNDLGKSVSRSFPKGTIIMTIAANIGFVAITEYEVFFPDSLIGINANEDIIDADYLMLNLMGYKNILDAQATESAQKNINYSNLRPLLIMFPTDKDEQKSIVQSIKNIYKQIDNKQEKITALELLKKSLMQQLLTGKVRVK